MKMEGETRRKRQRGQDWGWRESKEEKNKSKHDILLPVSWGGRPVGDFR